MEPFDTFLGPFNYTSTDFFNYFFNFSSEAALFILLVFVIIEFKAVVLGTVYPRAIQNEFPQATN